MDCAARLFPNPIDMIFYLKSRSDLYDQVMSESEHCFIGFHLTHKLALPDEFHGLAIDKDYAQPVDDFMMPFDVGVQGIRPTILERFDVPIVTDLLSELRSKGQKSPRWWSTSTTSQATCFATWRRISPDFEKR